MTHVRQTIREAAAAALVGETIAESSVFSSLVYPSESRELPLVHIRVDSEESDLAALGGTLQRVATLIITGIVDAEESDVDNRLDELAADIEAQIGGNTFSGNAKQTVLIGTEVSRSAEGSRPIAEIALSFAVVYHTAWNDGETAL